MTVTINGTTGYTGPIGAIGDLSTTGNTTLGDASGDTLTINGSTTTFTQGTANGVAYLNGSKVLTTGSALVFDGSNLGIGVAPSAWGSSFKSIDVNAYTSFYGTTSNAYSGFSQNAYYNGTNWIYRNTNAASNYIQSGGTHVWQTAGSGTAGNTISFTQALTLDASGNLGIGVTPSAWSGMNALQFNNGSVSWSANRNYINSNVYWNGSNWIRSTTGAANQFITSWYDNTFAWTSATSGAAGSTATLLTRMTLDASGNLGVGAVPAAWASGWGALQVGRGAISGVGGNFTQFSTNAYYNGTNYIYMANGYSGRIILDGDAGGISLNVAGSGSANGTISFTQAVTLSSVGNLGVGLTSPDARLHVANSGTNRASTVRTEAYYFYEEIQKTINDYRGVCDGVTGGYLLLIPAYPGSGTVSGKKFIGSVIADRGSEGTGNSVNYVHVLASTAYNGSIFLVKRDQANQYFSAASKVTYAGVDYLALKFDTGGGGPAYGIYLDGYHRGTDSNFFRLVLTSEVSNINDTYGTISNNF